MSRHGFSVILVIVASALVLLVSIFLFAQKTNHLSSVSKQVVQTSSPPSLPHSNESAVEAGKKLSNGQCQGEGTPYKLSVSPMKLSDFSHIEPYGLMIGGHVTPIDHQYFSPTIFKSAKDTYPVYAMADSKIMGLEVHPPVNGSNGSNGRIRMIFSVTCTFLYYYDLVTSVIPEINDKNLPVSVKAGQLIGHIGGQTLDFAVWDTTKPLAGFIVPEHYAAESWKIYTVDPLDYYTEELKSQILSKYVRTVEPVSGKIDYDVDGKVIGNWFEVGTNGFAGVATDPRTEYWKGHLSIVPSAYDPTANFISVGYLTDQQGSPANQFSVPRSAPKPETIGAENGLVKYDLRRWDDLKPDGTKWNHIEFTKGPRLDNESSPIEGCALVQLIEKRKLKFETFLKSSCESIRSFSQQARLYER